MGYFENPDISSCLQGARWFQVSGQDLYAILESGRHKLVNLFSNHHHEVEMILDMTAIKKLPLGVSVAFFFGSSSGSHGNLILKGPGSLSEFMQDFSQLSMDNDCLQMSKGIQKCQIFFQSGWSETRVLVGPARPVGGRPPSTVPVSLLPARISLSQCSHRTLCVLVPVVRCPA